MCSRPTRRSSSSSSRAVHAHPLPSARPSPSAFCPAAYERGVTLPVMRHVVALATCRLVSNAHAARASRAGRHYARSELVFHLPLRRQFGAHGGRRVALPPRRRHDRLVRRLPRQSVRVTAARPHSARSTARGTRTHCQSCIAHCGAGAPPKDRVRIPTNQTRASPRARSTRSCSITNSILSRRAGPPASQPALRVRLTSSLHPTPPPVPPLRIAQVPVITPADAEIPPWERGAVEKEPLRSLLSRILSGCGWQVPRAIIANVPSPPARASHEASTKRAAGLTRARVLSPGCRRSMVSGRRRTRPTGSSLLISCAPRVAPRNHPFFLARPAASLRLPDGRGCSCGGIADCRVCVWTDGAFGCNCADVWLQIC